MVPSRPAGHTAFGRVRGRPGRRPGSSRRDHRPRWSSLSRPRQPSVVEPVETTPQPRWSSLSRPRAAPGGRARRDHAQPPVVEPVETTPTPVVEPVETTPPLGGRACRDHAATLGGRACRDHAAWARPAPAGGSKKFSKKFPGPLWRTPFSGPECRCSVLELGHDREPRTTSTPPPRCSSSRGREDRRRRRRGGRQAAGGGGLGGDALGRLPRRGGHGVGPRRDRDAGRRTRRTPGRGVLGDRVRRRDRAADRGRQGLPRRGRRAPLPPQVDLVPGDQGRPARLAGPPGRPRDHASCRWRPPRTSTATSPTWRTRSAPPSSTGSSRRRSGGSCPRRPNAAAARPPTAGPSPSTRGNPPWPAPAPCTGSSTSPTPSTSTPPSPPGRRR